jgi:hypothetical protein
MLKFRCETLIGKESQKCLQAVQGGHQGSHKSTLVKYRHMPIPPACSSPLKTEDLLGSWPGRYMRMDSTQQHSLYGITVSPKLPPSSVLRPDPARPGYMAYQVQSRCTVLVSRRHADPASVICTVVDGRYRLSCCIPYRLP